MGLNLGYAATAFFAIAALFVAAAITIVAWFFIAPDGFIDVFSNSMNDGEAWAVAITTAGRLVARLLFTGLAAYVLGAVYWYLQRKRIEAANPSLLP